MKCILYDRKRGKAERFFNPIQKEGKPLNTYHIDHIDPLPTTATSTHLLVVDDFTRFVWLFPIKYTKTREVNEKISLQQTVFDNPSRIILERGPAFQSDKFSEYFKVQGIDPVKITTGMPRGNGQIEIINMILIPILAKFS